MEDEFSAGDREVLYRVIERRRDVRAFRPDPIPGLGGLVMRLLDHGEIAIFDQKLISG